MPFSFRSTALRFSIALVLSLTALSCEQFEHSSPLPGILEVRLGVVNNKTNLIPFSPVNFFGMTLGELNATQPGDLELPIFSDLHAIRRNDRGDVFNCLSMLAKDSMLILGETYAAPGTFTGLKFTMTPDDFLLVSFGSYFSTIIVAKKLPFQALQVLPRAGEQLSINIAEGRRTRVTVTLDLDSALVQRTEDFEYQPYFYVSSIQNF